jgi:hypothetical protein
MLTCLFLCALFLRFVGLFKWPMLRKNEFAQIMFQTQKGGNESIQNA